MKLLVSNVETLAFSLFFTRAQVKRGTTDELDTGWMNTGFKITQTLKVDDWGAIMPEITQTNNDNLVVQLSVVPTLVGYFSFFPSLSAFIVDT